LARVVPVTLVNYLTIDLLGAVDQLFREANIQMNGVVKYDDFVKIVCAPVPDYY
jgi:hypothetical protein